MNLQLESKQDTLEGEDQNKDLRSDPVPQLDKENEKAEQEEELEESDQEEENLIEEKYNIIRKGESRN